VWAHTSFEEGFQNIRLSSNLMVKVVRPNECLIETCKNITMILDFLRRTGYQKIAPSKIHLVYHQRISIRIWRKWSENNHIQNDSRRWQVDCEHFCAFFKKYPRLTLVFFFKLCLILSIVLFWFDSFWIGTHG